MKALEYEFEERALEDVPNPRQRPQTFWRRLYAHLDSLEPDRALFFKRSDDMTLPRLRDSLAGHIRRQYGSARWRLTADPDADGVWLYTATAKEPEATEAGPSPVVSDAPASTGHSMPAAVAETFSLADGIRPCACPEWWRRPLTQPRFPATEQPQTLFVTGGGASIIGNHHHESCPLFDRNVNNRSASCACDPYWRGSRRNFVADIANEAHEDNCPMYREGAHYWLVPSTTSPGSQYEAACAWCDQTRTFDPFDSQTDGHRAYKSPRPPESEPAIAIDTFGAPAGEPIRATKHRGPKPGAADRYCPECGGAWASQLHKICKSKKETAIA